MKLKILLFSLLLSQQSVYAQTSKDTSQYPYYLKMMQDRNVNFFQTVRAFNLYWQGRDSSVKGCGWKVFKRWEWGTRQIINADGSYPDMQQWVNDYYKAANGTGLNNNIFKGGMQTSAVTCKTKGDWKEIGPGFLPYNRTSQPGGVGRLNAVAFHPTDSNTLWVCAPAGGLWKSTNGGKTWSSNTDSMPTMGASALVVSPLNTDTMYLGTGDRDAGDATGLGVYMSANAGKTWISRNSGMGSLTVARLIIHPSNTKILLAATNGGIYRTTNSGGSWTQIISGNFKDIVFNPQNPNTVFATKDGLFYRSTNGGTSFTQISSGLPTSGIARGAIAVTAADTSYVYFLVCDNTKYYGTYRSTNGGTSFSTRSTTPNVMDYATNGSGTGGQAWYDLDVACDPSNKDVFFVGGVNIFKSTDGAATWTISAHWIGSSTLPSIHADQHNLEFHPITKSLYATNDGGIFYTPNSGAKWTDLSNGIGVSQIYKIGKSATNKDLMIAGFQDNGTSYFTGTDWNSVRGGDGMDCAWDRSNEDYSYGALYYGNITRFYKGVQDITAANNGVGGINETGDWVTPYCLRPDNTNTMFVGYKNIWRNTAIKGGTMTWSNISSNSSGSNIRCVECSPAKSDILYYSRYDNKFFRSYNANGTASWVDLTSSLPATGTPSAIACHPTDSNMVFIGLNGRLYQSRNRGNSWTDISSGLPVNRLNCIALDTSNSKFGIYVGTYTGVWYKDSTTTFSSFSNGLPINGSVTDLEIFYDKRHKSFHRLWGATYARGTWKTSLYDAGTNKPKTEFTMKLPKTCSEKIYTFTPECGYNPVNFKWLITPNTYSYQNSTDSLSEILKVKFNRAGYYNVRLVTENCNGTDTLLKQNFVTIFDTIATAANCKTTTNDLTTNYGMGILNFELNGTVNASSGAYDEGSNVDFSCTKSFLLKANTKYPTKVTTGPYYSEYVRIYIDYNNNGAFTDAGELVYSTYNKSIHSDTISTPSAPVKNKMLRMRVLSDYNSIASGCATLSYGQSEDYGVFFDEPTPNFTVSRDSTCVNTAVTITDATTGYGYNYTWNFGSGASPSTGTGKGPFSVKYTTSGIKKISMTINGSLTKSKDTAVVVLLTPSTSIFVKKGALSQCEKDSITLAARDSKKYATSFQWQKGNSNLSGSTDTLLKLWNNTVSVSGNYRVIASNGVCKDTTSNVTISINPYPKAGFTVNNLNQCLKGNKFIVTDTSKFSSGSYKALYIYSNSTTDTNKVHNKTFSSANTYTVKLRVTTNKGCKDSASKTLTVFPNTSVGFTVNDSDQCKNGNSFVYTNTSSISSGSFSSQWLYGNSNTANTTNGSQSYASYGNYNVSLITTTNNNCLDTLTRKIVVFPSPVAAYTIFDSSECLKGNKFIYLNTSSVSSGTNTYKWSFGDNTTSTLTHPTKTYAGAGSFSCKLVATTNNNCKDSVSHLMTTYPQTQAGFSVNDSDQCQKGNLFNFSNTSVLASGTFTSSWNYGNSNTSSSSNGVQSYLNNGNYVVRLITVTNYNCKDTAFKTVIVFASPLPSFSVNDSDQCLRGNKFVFTNKTTIAAGTSSYIWQYGDNTGSSATNGITKNYANYNTYTVQLKATSDKGCADSVTRQMLVFPMPAAAYKVNDSSQCQPINQFIFNSQSTISSGTLSFLWSYGDGNTSTAFTPVKSYANPSVYNTRLIVSSNFGCKDTAYRTLEVYSKPSASFTVSPAVQCVNGNKFTVNTTGTSAKTASVLYDLGDSSTSTNNTFSYAYNTSGTYRILLTMTVKPGCFDTISKTVNVLESPAAMFTVDNAPQCQRNNLIRFTNTSTPPSQIANLWTYGDGDTSVNLQDAHHYGNFGTYSVKLIAQHFNGCADTLIKTLIINEDPRARFAVNDSDQCQKVNHFVFTNNATISAGTLNAGWSFGDNTTALTNSPTHTYINPGIYAVRLISSTPSCQDTMTRKMIVFQNPVATFRINNVNALTKKFTATNKNYLAYSWKFSDGFSGSDTVVQHNFADGKGYNVQLVVTDSNKCTDTIQQTFNASTGVDQVTLLHNKTSIFPNPASVDISIVFELVNDGFAHYSVYDVNGKLITDTRKDRLGKGTYTFPFSFEKFDLAPGTYFFELETNEGKMVNKVVYTR